MNEICESLDPQYQMIVGRLGRESTLLKNGKYIKDLSYLNRDLKQVVYIDFTDETAEFHKDNVILLPRWDGSNFDDRELYDLIPFLENLGEARNVDVRAEIKKYGREGTGPKFREMQLARQQYIMQQRVTIIFTINYKFYRTLESEAWSIDYSSHRREPLLVSSHRRLRISLAKSDKVMKHLDSNNENTKQDEN